MKISIYIATSANGFISNQRNVPDWLSPEYEQGFMEICKQKRAVIMGKTTYNILAPDYLPLKDDGITVVLTSATDMTALNQTVLFTALEPASIVSMLEEKGYTEAVIIGGASTITGFVHSGVVNELIFMVEPVLFGSGLSMLEHSELELKLALKEIAQKNANTVLLTYSVLN